VTAGLLASAREPLGSFHLSLVDAIEAVGGIDALELLALAVPGDDDRLAVWSRSACHQSVADAVRSGTLVHPLPPIRINLVVLGGGDGLAGEGGREKGDDVEMHFEPLCLDEAPCRVRWWSGKQECEGLVVRSSQKMLEVSVLRISTRDRNHQASYIPIWSTLFVPACL